MNRKKSKERYEAFTVYYTEDGRMEIEFSGAMEKCHEKDALAYVQIAHDEFGDLSDKIFNKYFKDK